MRDGSKDCHNHLVTNNNHVVVKKYGYIPQSGNLESIPARLMNNYKDKSRCHTGIYRRLLEDQPSVVIGYKVIRDKCGLGCFRK